MSDGIFRAAHDLAGLPGMPKTPSGAIRWLRAHNITSREVAGRGGPSGKRTEYAVVELPRETRAALALDAARGVRIDGTDIDAAKIGAVEGAKLALRDGLAERAIRAVQEESLKASVAIRGKSEQRMEAKLAILREREAFQKNGQLSVKASEHYFAAAYNKREIHVAEWVRALVPDVSPATLTLWRRVVRTKGITALAGNYGNRKGDGKIDRQPQLRDFIIAMLVETPHVRATHVEEAIETRLATTPIKKPSLSALERWLAAWRRENAQTLLALSNPDAWKSKHMVAFGSASEGVARLNQRWELDSTPADVMFTDGRHSLLGGIDVYSRRACLLVAKTSTAESIAALLRRMLLEFGVPEEIKTDRGDDYTSKHITRVVHALDIEHKLCNRFAGWEKPFIERFFGTFTRSLVVELQRAFIGHNVAERKAIESRKSFAERLLTRGEVIECDMSSVEFQDICDRWLDAVYSRDAHRELDGKSPFEMAANWPHQVRHIGDERALDVLLAPVAGDNGYRTVQKKGLLIDGAWFIAPDLGSAPGARVGERVLCLALPDLGRVVVQGGDDMRFICIAECPERTGVNRRDIAILARKNQLAREQEQRRALRANARKQSTDEIVEQYLVQRAAQAGKVAAFPKPAIVHQSAGLAAASEAVAALNPPARSTAELMSDDAARAARARIDGVTAGADNELARRRLQSGPRVQPIFENAYERVTWLLAEAKTRALTDEEQEALATYRRAQPASYRQLQSMVDERFASTGKDDAPEVGAA